MPRIGKQVPSLRRGFQERPGSLQRAKGARQDIHGELEPGSFCHSLGKPGKQEVARHLLLVRLGKNGLDGFLLRGRIAASGKDRVEVKRGGPDGCSHQERSDQGCGQGAKPRLRQNVLSSRVGGGNVPPAGVIGPTPPPCPWPWPWSWPSWNRPGRQIASPQPPAPGGARHSQQCGG